MMKIRYGAGPTIRAISASDISFVRHSTPIPTITSEPSTTTVTTKDRAVITAQSATYYRDWDLRADIYIDKNNALARGQFVCLDTEVADFVGSVLTRKTNGTARVNYETQIGTWQDIHNVSETVDNVAIDYAYAAGSLARHITDAITALATGHTAGDMPQYSTRDDSTATYVRNPNCWTASLDTTGLSVWNSLGGQHRAGVAISPRHTLHALHYPVTVGTVLRFVTADNSVITRTVDAVYGVPQAAAYQKDLQIARLDSDLPGTIKPMKFLPANAGDYLPTWDQPYLYAIGTNARKQSICALSQLSVVIPPTISVTITSTREEPYAALYTPIIVGDSGSPIILPINGEAVLIGHWTFATAGPAHHLLLTEIATALTTLGGGHSLSTVDLSSFINYNPSSITNLIAQSATFDNADWIKSRLTVTANAATSPDGTTTADKLKPSVDNNDHRLYTSSTVTNGATYTYSVHLKRAEVRWVVLYSGTGKGRYFDLQDGVMGGAFIGTPTNSTITHVGNGWYRCSITVVANSTSHIATIYPAEADGDVSFVGNASDGLLAWGAQLESGSVVNAYSATT